MPTYTYRCKNCKHIEELFHGMMENGLKDAECSKCKTGRFERIINSVNFSIGHKKSVVKQVQKMEDMVQEQRSAAKSVGLYDG